MAGNPNNWPTPRAMLNNGVDIPTFPAIAPLRLSPDFRDYFGRQHEKFTEMLDPIIATGCYQPRIHHAPSSSEEAVGLPPGGYLEYALELPAGGFIIGFRHHSLGVYDGETGIATAGFSFQITDIARNYSLFGKPVPESWLLNDALSMDPNSLIQGATYELNPSDRLLPAPYPIAPPGQFRVEFWDTRLNPSTNNTKFQLTLVVATPPEDQGHGQ
jgi:hypothetical protein